MCQANGSMCKVCLKNLIENVEASSSIRLPESRTRCDSVDITSLYLKKSDIVETEEPLTPIHMKNAIQRGNLREIIMSGNMRAAIEYITYNFPDTLNDEECMLYIHIQEFIEFIRINDVDSALFLAREKFSKFKHYNVYCRKNFDSEIPLIEIVGLLAYINPHESPLAYLLTKSQLELTADIVNQKILKNEKEGCDLENMLKHTLSTQGLFQESVLMTKTSQITFLV